MFFRVTLFLLCFTSWTSGANDDLQKDGICPPVLDIIILFDTSGGNDTVYQQQKNWTIEIVRELPIHEDAVRVGLIQYSEDARTEFNLSRYSERNDLIKNFDTLEFSQGDTKTGVALNKADEEIFNYAGGARLKASRMIIVFTDGLSMDNPTKAAKTLRRKGVKIFTISVNSIGFVPEMLGIVGDADNVFGPTDEERLKERLLAEVEHSRSCDVQPKKNEKTTSAFKSRTTEFFTTVASVEVTESTSVTPVVEDSEGSSTKKLESESSAESVATGNTSEQLKPSNHIEDIGIPDEPALQSLNSTSAPTDVSHAWSEPIQLFTVESEHLTEAHKLTNLTNLLAEEEHVPKNLTTGNKSEVTEDITISTFTTIAPAVTTICITQPVATSTVTPVTSQSSTESFLTKLGVKKEKEKEKDPISKFLGRDVPNITSEKDNEKEKGNDNKKGNEHFGNSSEDKEVSSKKSESSNNSSNDSESSETSIATTTPSPKPSTKFAFATRVTFRPAFIASSRSSTIQSTTESTPITESSTPAPTTSATVKTSSTKTTTTTTTATVPTTTSTTTSQSISTTTLAPTSIAFTASSTLPPRTPTRRFTPTQSSSSILNTLSGVTAFPTLLSMEKAVTLPINKANVKPMKKKIRRIIKRRRNILPSSQAKKVTEKVVEVKHDPTPTTPPVRSTLKPEIVEEEKQEEIASSPGVQCPMDILFVVDSSGSIARTYDTQKDFLTVLIKKVEPSRSHRVGLIQFAGPHIQKMEWSFDTHSKNSQLLSAIRSVRHLTGTTYIGAALELSLILLDSRRKHTETTVILISDGFSQDDSTQQAKLLRQLPNVKMYAISLNKLTNTRYLTDIVGDRKNLFVNDESKWFEEFFTKKLRCIPTRR